MSDRPLDFDVRETTGVRDLDTVLDEQFQAQKKHWDDAWRQRDEEARKERELERMVEEITAKEAKAARAARPIQVKTFEIE